jgi:UDP-glucose 4-epimerase
MADGVAAENKVILVTGVGSYRGAQVASHLLAVPFPAASPWHVIGPDNQPPAEEIKGLDFIQADVRNPLLVELLKSENVHTVCHLILMESVHPSEAAFDLNVMGAMKVLGACAEAGVRKVVLKSNTSVHGANPANPSYITEKHPWQGGRLYGYTRHWVEVEAFCNSFRRLSPFVILTILRFANILGLQADTVLEDVKHD